MTSLGGLRLWIGLLGWMILPAGPSLAGAPPDSARLAALQSACDAAWRLRVTGARATFEVSHPTFDEAGARWPRGTGRVALITGRDAAFPSRSMPWTEIERIDVERSMAGRRALIGFGLGLGVGAAMLLAYGPDIGEKGDNGILELAVAATVVGATAGWLAGALMPERRPIFP